MPYKIANVVGARPQFIKAAPVSLALRKAGHQEILIHTGQHYDHEMSGVFFDELGINEPDINLGVGSGRHGWQIAQILERAEELFVSEEPDWILVYGDTNSTIGAALAANKLGFHLAHIEAGLRSYNREMPEEINRVLTDHCSDLLFCPTQQAVLNLEAEGITEHVHLVGDVMYDAALMFGKIAAQKSNILLTLNVEPGGYLLATIHRPGNVDDRKSLEKILQSLVLIDEPIILPLHPRTRESIIRFDLENYFVEQESKVQVIQPLGYLDMLKLEQNARLILTDSGGVQKEAYYFKVPCITLRDETEWTETVESGWNIITGADQDEIIRAVRTINPQDATEQLYGDGKASYKIVEALEATINSV